MGPRVSTGMLRHASPCGMIPPPPDLERSSRMRRRVLPFLRPVQKEPKLMNRLPFIALLACIGSGVVSAQSQPVYTIGTFAGTGSLGEGGPATSAVTSYGYGVAVDGSGNLYFADYPGARVYKVSPDGVMTAYAGTGV